MQIMEVSSGDEVEPLPPASNSNANNSNNNNNNNINIFHASSPSSIIDGIEKLVTEIEQPGPPLAGRAAAAARRLCAVALPPPGSFPLSQDDRLALWKLSYRIWNACVDMSNHNNHNNGVDVDVAAVAEDHAKLRQFACDLLLLAGGIGDIPSSLFKTAVFFYRTGLVWQKAGNLAMASACMEKATELSSKARGGDENNAANPSSSSPLFEREEEGKFLFDLYAARARIAWDLSNKTLSCSLLGRARKQLQVVALSDKRQELAEQYLHFGKCLVAMPDKPSQAESIKFLEQALEICSESSSGTIFNHQGLTLKQAVQVNNSPLRTRILRYLAAGHLLNENFESVLKCVVLLRGGGEDRHPSTSFLSLKALIGLHRYEEAENELFNLITHTATPMHVCISSLEVAILAPNFENLEPVKKAFFLLNARYPGNKDLILSVLEKLLRQTSSLIQVETALSIAVDERIVNAVMMSNNNNNSNNRISPLQFSDDQSKATILQVQQCAFTLLWNSGSEHFQAKIYATSIRLFEASLLYLPDGVEYEAQRAKGLRVLCLCHLGLGHYDRASEYILEAEKFKIFLETSDEQGACMQVEKMHRCPDFDPDYLTLASHEAISCKKIKVAISALSSLLNLRTSGKPLDPSREVAIIRNIIVLSSQDQEGDPNCILKYFKRAQTRLAELGYEGFFGSGNAGEKEANWFASFSWNQGLSAGKSQNWSLSAELLALASDFYEALPGIPENRIMRKKALLMTVAAMLAASGKDDESYLRLAALYLEKCRKVDVSVSSGGGGGGQLPNLDQDEFIAIETYLNLLAFDLKGRLHLHSDQLDILYHCSSLPGFSWESLWKMGLVACEGQYQNVQVAGAALRACLNLILSSPSPDYKMGATIIRKLIQLADSQNRDGPETLEMYKQAKQVLLGLSVGHYPKDEAQWLVSTAWNRAALHIKLSRFQEAENWMTLALDLLKHAPSMEAHKPAMIANLAEVLKAKSDHASKQALL